MKDHFTCGPRILHSDVFALGLGQVGLSEAVCEAFKVVFLFPIEPEDQMFWGTCLFCAESKRKQCSFWLVKL